MCLSVVCDCGQQGASAGCVSDYFAAQTFEHGFRPRSHEDDTPSTCYRDTIKCNRAAMTSPFGHMIVVVALLVSVIFVYLLCTSP